MRLEKLTAKALEVPGATHYQLEIAIATQASALQNGEMRRLNVQSKAVKPADLELLESAEGFSTIKGFQASK